MFLLELFLDNFEESLISQNYFYFFKGKSAFWETEVFSPFKW